MLDRTILAAVIAAVAGCGSADVSRSVGARCDLASECDERCLAAPAFPGGFCSLSCDRTSDCPGDDTACVEAEGGVCLFRCQDDRDCDFLGDGWVCADELLRGGDGGQVGVCRGG